ncbi:Formin-like protein 2 [Varanus komodoensis]|nr:Formin-like protein 2 [Varanus komodoensis]
MCECTDGHSKNISYSHSSVFFTKHIVTLRDEMTEEVERFQVKNPPHTYIQKLKGYLDPAVTRKKFRRRVQESTQVLRELEISLRTNHIGWVREFLNEENKGLDVLVEYLSFAQYAVT